MSDPDGQAPAATPPGPDPGALVWLAVPRRGIDAHRPATPADAGEDPVPLTGCARSMRAGVTMTADAAQRAHQVTWCPRCWPEPTADERARIADLFGVPAALLADATPGRAA